MNEMEFSMYQRLQMLPVFNGVSNEDLTYILTLLHVDFGHMMDGETLVNQGDRCENFIFVLNGTLSAEKTSKDGLFSITETVSGPMVIEPWNIYGMTQKYEHTYTSIDEVDILTVSKREFNSVMLESKIVKTNIMNMYCAKIHAMTRIMDEYEPETVSKKMLRFIQCNVLNTKGNKTLQIKMEDFAYIIKETRLNISNALKEFKQAGLLGPSRRGGIEILDMQNFIKYVTQ